MCDPAIKLFGKTIALPSHTDRAGACRGGGGGVKGCSNNEEINTESKPNSEDKCDEPMTSSTTTTSSAADRETQLQKPPPSAAAAADDDDHHHHHQEEEKGPKTDQEEEEQQQQQQQQDEKPALKKPDKILPCPRCKSMDTKFCYYNNYNVNQPRHFCKNCQRYWTAGGTMRNVPVGAGRRKNKNAAAAAAVAAAAAHYRQLTRTDAGPALKPKGTVLSFGSDMPLSESMASVLDLAEKSMKKRCNRSSGLQRMEEHVEEQSTGSSATNSNSAADDEGNNGANLQEPAGIRNCQGLPPHLLYIGSSSPWAFPWNPPPPTPPTSAPFCGSTFPIPIYPATAYWGGCGAWSIPWLAPLQGSPSPTSTLPGCGPPNSPTTTMLGKHSREGNVLHRVSPADTVNKQSSQEKCLWIPKTLRIDNPEEAAKSSIWATMGFSRKNDKADGFSSLGGGLFRSFQTKTELWSRRVEASQALHANPAALSRSIKFQESS